MDRSLWIARLCRHQYAALLLSAIVGLLYWPTLGYGFSYEDLNDIERFLQPFFWYDGRIDRMVTSWTYGVSAWLSPMEPWGYHLVSVALHALNTVLLFGVAARVFPFGAAFVCAALFAVHPIQTESVAYISGRADLVMATGVLIAMLGVETHRLWVMVLGWCVAIGGKEIGIVAVPLTGLWMLARGWRMRRAMVAPSLFAISAGVLLAIRFEVFQSQLDPYYTAMETAKLWHLLGLVVLPLGLSIDHDYSQWPVLWPVVALLGTLLLVGVALCDRRWWARGVLFVAVALAPRLLIPLVEGLHEHHLTTPMIGICLALVGTFTKGQDCGISATSA